MRPLTPRRILAICGMLAAILFVGGGDFAARGRLSHRHAGHCHHAVQPAPPATATVSEFSQVIFGLRLPRIALGNPGGRGAFHLWGRISGAAAQSAG